MTVKPGGLEERPLGVGATATGDERMTALAGCPGVGRLGFLGLNAVVLTAVGARALLDSPHFSRDMHVHLGGNAPQIRERLGDALVRRFAEVAYERNPHIDTAW